MRAMFLLAIALPALALPALAADPAAEPAADKPVPVEQIVPFSPSFVYAVRRGSDVQPDLLATTLAPDLDICWAGAPQLVQPSRVGPPLGHVEVQLDFRKGKVSLVTVTSVDPGLEWMTPCLKQRLAHAAWQTKKKDQVTLELDVMDHLEK